MGHSHAGHTHSHGPGGHSHSHGHHGSGGAAPNQLRLTFVLLLSFAYLIAEIIGGYLTNSLALFADAGHMFSDVAALGLSLFAVRMAARPPSARQSYGYYRTEILAALINGATLIAVSIYILISAYGRLRHPPHVAGGLMMVIAIGGVLSSVAGLLILHSGKNDNLNIRGAWLHLATDAMGGVGVIIGAILVWRFGWTLADPIASILISFLVIYSAWSLVSESVSILMEATPAHIDSDTVRAALASVHGVDGVHDLHIWSITSGMYAVSTHVVVTPGTHDRVLSDVRAILHDRFGIEHSTVQCEPPGFLEPATHA